MTILCLAIARGVNKAVAYLKVVNFTIVSIDSRMSVYYGTVQPVRPPNFHIVAIISIGGCFERSEKAKGFQAIARKDELDSLSISAVRTGWLLARFEILHFEPKMSIKFCNFSR